MSKLETKQFDAPDEVRPFSGHGHVDLLQLGTGDVGLGTFEPGWKWSNDVSPHIQPQQVLALPQHFQSDQRTCHDQCGYGWLALFSHWAQEAFSASSG